LSYSRQSGQLNTPGLSKQSARGAQLKHFAGIVHLPLTGRPSAPCGILQLNVRRETDDRWGQLTERISLPNTAVVLFHLCYLMMSFIYSKQLEYKKGCEYINQIHKRVQQVGGAEG
jgi:hypothetical protein